MFSEKNSTKEWPIQVHILIPDQQIHRPCINISFIITEFMFQYQYQSQSYKDKNKQIKVSQHFVSHYSKDDQNHIQQCEEESNLSHLRRTPTCEQELISNVKTDSSLQNSPCSYVPDIYILSQTLALSQTVTLISHSYICICFKIHHADSTLQKLVTYSYVPDSYILSQTANQHSAKQW